MDEFIWTALCSCEHGRKGLYNIGFAIPLYVPVVLMGSDLQAVYIGGAPNML